MASVQAPTRAVIDAVAAAAERCWVRDAVVGRTRRDGGPSRRRAIRTPTTDRSPCPPTADWIDPLIGLSFAAAATSTIGIATGVLLLPEHNPVLVAKQAATLDTLSGGRFTLGIGVGWSREEFDALGVPFERRAARTAEYVAAMRTLWRDDVASFDGEFVRFDSVRVNPKPVARQPHSDRARRQQRRGAAPGRRVGRRLVRVQPRRCAAKSPNGSISSSGCAANSGRDPDRTAAGRGAARPEASTTSRPLAELGSRRTGRRRGSAGRRRCRSRLGIGARR